MTGKPKKTVDKRITPAFIAQAGKGRPKGVKNKIPQEIKEMVCTALSLAGGTQYLVRQAEENPTAFLTLVRAIIPLTVNATHTVKHDELILEERRSYAAQLEQRLN